METAQWPLQGVERRVRPHKEKALNCPRCNSTNTKFCYYNNYSLSQPRYFCKSCRRYWTEGGSLRNIPVGGGSRKKKISYNSSSSSSLPSTTTSTPSLTLSSSSSSSSRNMHPSKLSSFVSLSSSVAALEPIRSGISSTKLVSSFPSQSLCWKEIHGVNIEELMWPSMVKFPLERKEIALPYEDLKQVGDNKVCEGGEDQTLFWEGVMGNGEGGGGEW